VGAGEERAYALSSPACTKRLLRRLHQHQNEVFPNVVFGVCMATQLNSVCDYDIRLDSNIKPGAFKKAGSLAAIK
jgi:hypothetical protein